MIPVSKVVLKDSVGKLVSYRTTHCICYVCDPTLHVHMMEFIDYCIKNLLTIEDHYRRSVKEEGVSWNTVEYGTLSFQTDLFDVVDSDGKLKYILVSPYLVWLVGSWILDVSLPYKNKEEPMDFLDADKEYLTELFEYGKSEGWFELCYRFDNTGGKMDRTADNFVFVKNPKLVAKERLRQELSNTGSKPWFSYNLSEAYHTLMSNGKFYTAYTVNGCLQFITLTSSYMDVTGDDHLDLQQIPMKEDILEWCGRILEDPNVQELY